MIKICGGVELKTAYEVLKNPRTRRHYDSNRFEHEQNGGTSSFNADTSAFPQPDWTQFLREVVQEFMNSKYFRIVFTEGSYMNSFLPLFSYEPVLAVVDYFPEMSITRDSARNTLNSLRETISSIYAIQVCTYCFSTFNRF